MEKTAMLSGLGERPVSMHSINTSRAPTTGQVHSRSCAYKTEPNRIPALEGLIQGSMWGTAPQAQTSMARTAPIFTSTGFTALWCWGAQDDCLMCLCVLSKEYMEF